MFDYAAYLSVLESVTFAPKIHPLPIRNTAVIIRYTEMNEDSMVLSLDRIVQ